MKDIDQIELKGEGDDSLVLYEKSDDFGDKNESQSELGRSIIDKRMIDEKLAYDPEENQEKFDFVQNDVKKEIINDETINKPIKEIVKEENKEIIKNEEPIYIEKKEEEKKENIEEEISTNINQKKEVIRKEVPDPQDITSMTRRRRERGRRRRRANRNYGRNFNRNNYNNNYYNNNNYINNNNYNNYNNRNVSRRGN